MSNQISTYVMTSSQIVKSEKTRTMLHNHTFIRLISRRFATTESCFFSRYGNHSKSSFERHNW